MLGANGVRRFGAKERRSPQYKPRNKYAASVQVVLKRGTKGTKGKVSIYVYLHERFHEVIKPGATLAVRGEKTKTTEDRGAVQFRAAKGKDLREDFVEIYRIETRDLHIVRSSHEKLIDDWLFHHGIDHDVPGPLSEGYPISRCARDFNHGDGYYIPDFILHLPRGPVVVEHYGFGGAWIPGKEYLQNRERKEAFYRGLAKRTNIRYEALEPPSNEQDWEEMLMERLGKYIGEEPEPKPITVSSLSEPEPIAEPPAIVPSDSQSVPGARVDPPADIKEPKSIVGAVADAIMSGLRGLFGRIR